MGLKRFEKLRIKSGHRALVVTYEARTIARTGVEGYILLVDANGFLVSLQAEARSISPALMTTVDEVAMTLSIE